MLRVLVLVAALLLKDVMSFHNFADVPCGKAKKRTGKIVGGEDAVEGEFPWLVSLTRRGAHFCGGSLLTRTHVLTAGHCLCSGGAPFSPRQIRVTLGQHDLKKNSVNKKEVAVKRAVTHPDYVCTKVRNDLAILELQSEVQWSEFALPACLPQGEGESGYQRFADVVATVAGWGWTHEDYAKGKRADILQKAKVNIIKSETCQAWYKSQEMKTKIQNTQMCAGFEKGGIDACWADSGGPLMVATPGDQAVVVGVVSTGMGCARPFLPGLYTRVSEFLPWIRDVLQV